MQKTQNKRCKSREQRPGDKGECAEHPNIGGGGAKSGRGEKKNANTRSIAAGGEVFKGLLWISRRRFSFPASFPS